MRWPFCLRGIGREFSFDADGCPGAEAHRECKDQGTAEAERFAGNA